MRVGASAGVPRKRADCLCVGSVRDRHRGHPQIAQEMWHSLANQHDAALMLRLRVRRGVHLVDDAMGELSIVPPADYKKPLMVGGCPGA